MPLKCSFLFFCSVVFLTGVPIKDSAPLSPLNPSTAPVDTEQQNAEKGNFALSNDLQTPRVAMETSNLRPQTPKPEDEAEDEDDSSGALTISELVYRFATKL